MVSGIVTAILLAIFIAGSLWAFSGRRRGEFERAAQLPLEQFEREARSLAEAASAGVDP